MSLTRELQEKFDIVWKKNPIATEHPMWRSCELGPHTIDLIKGHVRSEGYQSFPTDVKYDKDVAIKTQDGLHIYADVFRPATSDSEPVPGIVTWGPFGKTGSGL